MDNQNNNLLEQLIHPQDVTIEFDSNDISANQIVAAAVTIPILFWLPFIVNTDSRYLKFYGNQSLTLLVADVVAGVAGGIISKILHLIPFVGTLLGSLIVLALSALIVAGWVLLLVSALQGRARKLPIVGDMIQVFQI